MNQKKINEVFERFALKDSHPKTELNYNNNFTLLVAIILSAQSTDISVNKATEKLFLQVNTPADMLQLGEEKLKDYIKTVGLFNSKASNIIKLSRILIEDYNSEIPTDLELLKSLPGVGSKTANVFLNCAHQMPTIGVDTHVFRVSNRIGLVKAGTVKEAEKLLDKKVPDRWKFFAHHWLILHGRYICKAKKPDCGNCLIRDLCEFPSKNFPS
jgi:endonuclease-3